MRKTLILAVALTVVLVGAGMAHAISTTNWTEYASNPVYAPGKAYYPTILKEGSTYRMWSDKSGGVQMATSTDAVNWTTNPGTVTGLTTPKHTLVENIGGTYRMWYWPNLSYSINDIRTATSTDGLTWTGDQAVTQVSNSVLGYTGNSNTWWRRGSYGPADIIYNSGGSATIVEPTSEASVWANKFVMYYDATTGGSEALGLAVSNDGINWQGYNGGIAAVLGGTYSGNPDWDENYVSRATVIKENDDAYHMWYSGGHGTMNHGIGYAFSTDGINWTRDTGNPIFHKDDGVVWRANRTYTPMVIGDEMWFTGKSNAGAYTIGYAQGGGSGPGYIPEPATILLLGGGLIGLVTARRKRK